MADQFKNLMIGFFVTAAAAVVIFILMFLHPRVGDEGKILHVRFTDIDKVTIGTRVTYAGKPVGEVIGIEEIEEGHDGRADGDGHLYVYDVALRVDSKIKVYNTDEIALRTSGLLGEKNVDIMPVAPKKGQKLIEIDEKPIYAQETGSVEETFKEFKAVADKIQESLTSVNKIFDRINDNRVIDKITDIIENMDSITTALNLPDTITNILQNIDSITSSLNAPNTISDIIQNIDKFTIRINDSWVNVDKTILDIDDAALSFREVARHGKGIFEKVSNGEGTLGKFLVQDDFYLRTNSIMSKLETILDDINHYGLLFQSDKGWQRLRARRLNLLQQLSTPQEFRNYFNDEIDQISTSLSRVYQVMNKVENCSCCAELMMDREFTKVFAELMRRVAMLEEEVRMYNTQVVELQVHKTELGEAPCCQ